MKLLYVEDNKSERQLVTGIHYMPEQLSKELIDRMVLVDTLLPEPVAVDRKSHQRYVNPKTGVQWFETVDVPLTEQEVIKDKIKALELAMDDLIFGGM